MPPKKKATLNKNVKSHKKKEYTDSRSYDALLNKIAKKIPLFIWYYGDWCGHCKIMEQDWVELANSVSGEKKNKTMKTVQLVRIESRYLDGRAEVSAYPTLRLYKEGKIYDEYLGERTASSMLSYLKRKL